MKAAFVVFDRMTSLDFIDIYDSVARLKSIKIIDEFERHFCATTPRVVDDGDIVAAGGDPSAIDAVLHIVQNSRVHRSVSELRPRWGTRTSTVPSVYPNPTLK